MTWLERLLIGDSIIGVMREDESSLWRPKKGFKVRLTKDGVCQESIHYLEGKEPIPCGSVVEITEVYDNFYGRFMVTYFKGKRYYLKSNILELVEEVE